MVKSYNSIAQEEQLKKKNTGAFRNKHNDYTKQIYSSNMVKCKICIFLPSRESKEKRDINRVVRLSMKHMTQYVQLGTKERGR